MFTARLQNLTRIFSNRFSVAPARTHPAELLMESTTNPLLLAALKNPRDVQAQHQFVERYLPFVVAGFRKRRLADPEELARELLLKLLLRISSPEWQYDPERSFRGFIQVSLRHAFFEMLRDRKAHPDRARGGDSALEFLEQIAAPSPPNPGESTADRDLEGELGTELMRDIAGEAETRVESRVSPETWRIYLQWKQWMLDRATPGARALADELGITEDAVHKASSRARKMVRQEISRILSQRTET